MGTIRVDGSLLGKQVPGDGIGGDPNVVATSQVTLVDRAIFLSPLGELDVTVLLGHIGY